MPIEPPGESPKTGDATPAPDEKATLKKWRIIILVVIIVVSAIGYLITGN